MNKLLLALSDGLEIKVDNGCISKKGNSLKNIRRYYICASQNALLASNNAVNKKAATRLNNIE